MPDFKPKQHYEVLVGLNLPPDRRRAGPGSVLDDIPPIDIEWLLETGRIVATDKPLAIIDDTAGRTQVFGAVVDSFATAEDSHEEE